LGKIRIEAQQAFPKNKKKGSGKREYRKKEEGNQAWRSHERNGERTLGKKQGPSKENAQTPKGSKEDGPPTPSATGKRGRIRRMTV